MPEVKTSATRFGPSDFLAAERTFLAWIRTGIALMGFGFVVARFGLFLQELREESHLPVAPSSAMSLGFGTALIIVGVAVNGFSAWSHIRLVRGLNQNLEYNRPSWTALIVALVLALIGLALAAYLIFYPDVRKSI
jgi:putative membrane protein